MNHLKDQTSPYLLQHADQPVDWYPWCDAAFAKAKAEDKPVFLSIGYSTCHWCHVMAHESFDSTEAAALLNRFFVCIKVDKEERPDIDGIYMAVCQAFTGSGGWPTSIFMTWDQKPFFAGTYFPKTARYGAVGFLELLTVIHEKWSTDRAALLHSAEQIVSHLNRETPSFGTADADLLVSALSLFEQSFDKQYGGFGDAPKFPTPHNLLFLLTYYEKRGHTGALHMAEKTLQQMYRGGLFDHIGYGFSRYSTDRFFLVPHFEKMLYDNALLIMSYCKAYSVTKKELYRDVACKTAAYILREMTRAGGGFYSAQDADSDGVEGRYYVFAPEELIRVLGPETGGAFNRYYDITEAGNFEGKSIPNLLQTPEPTDPFASCLPTVYEYRKSRTRLHLDDKILTAWNALMIAALSFLYRITGNRTYLDAAKQAQAMIEAELCDHESLFVSFRDGTRSGKGFLDDYAFDTFALLALYEATLEPAYLQKARQLCRKAVSDFYDGAQGGFWQYGAEHEQLILRPKETYDGAVPSGNSVMAYNLVRFFHTTMDAEYEPLAKRQLDFLSGPAAQYPPGYSMFLTALLEFLDAPETCLVVVGGNGIPSDLSCRLPLGWIVTVLEHATQEYRLKNGKTTYYVCRNHSCLPPVNELADLI